MGFYSKFWCLGQPNSESEDRLKLLRIYKYNDLEIATGSFSEKALLGRGSYGAVYKATLRNKQMVAVKRATCSTANLSCKNELHILSKIHSAHVVNLLGFCHHRDELLLVIELMSNGSLHDALHSPESRPGEGSGSFNLSWARRMRIALQIAKAIHALHSATPQIIHRDIKSSNILLDSKWNARLGDFGLALRGQGEEIARTPAGTLGYADPRYDKPDKVGPKIDVFSFGVLLLEIVSGRPAMGDSRSPVRIVDWALPLIKRGNTRAVCDPRVALPGSVAGIRRVLVIAARCVRRESKRPSMGDIVLELGRIRRECFEAPRRGGAISRAVVLPCPPPAASLDDPPASFSRSKRSCSSSCRGEIARQGFGLELPTPPIEQAVAMRSSHF